MDAAMTREGGARSTGTRPIVADRWQGLAWFAIPMMIAVIVLGFCAFAYAPSLFIRLFAAAKDAPDLASTLISTAFNIGIATGSTLGALALANGASYPSLAWIGIAAAGTAIAAVLAMVMGREPQPMLQPAE